MNILLIAPQPFYSERGTPIAIDLLLQALAKRGENVDLLTLHIGEDRKYDGVRLFRISPWPNPKAIKPGISIRKIWCDLFLLFKAFRMARRENYDYVHAIEEAGFIGWVIRKTIGTPYVLDMDSSMSDQIMDSLPRLNVFSRQLNWLESIPTKSATAVVPMCDALAESASAVSSAKVFVLNDICLPGNPDAQVDDLREELRLGDQLIAMYVGNLEPYQGIDLLLDSFALVMPQIPNCHLIVIGGREADVEKYRAKAVALGASDSVTFVGPRPVDGLAAYLSQSDVLVSPRVQGTNTPMKVYSYLGSGRPVVATRLPTHTQVMDDSVSALAEPNPEDFAAALVRVLANKELRDKLADNAASLVSDKYSWPAFERKVNQIYDFLRADLEGRQVDNG